MNTLANIQELARALRNMIRTGLVVETNLKAGRCRVQTGGMCTDWLQWLTCRAGRSRTWWAPSVGDLEHISQSIGDILRTPVGSRVMRRDYGSLLASMIDQPQTPALELQIKVACYMAVLKWEPRVTLSSVTTERSFDGRMTVTLTGQHNDTGQPLSLTIPVS